MAKTYNKFFPITKYFNNYRIYLYKMNDSEFFPNNSLRFLYVIKGDINLELLDLKLNLRENDLIYLGPNLSHKLIENDKENLLLILEIKYEFIDSYDYTNYNYLNSFCDFFTDSEKESILILMKYMYVLSFTSYWDSLKTDNNINNLISILKKSDALSYINTNDNTTVEATIYKIANYIDYNLENNNHDLVNLDIISKKFNASYHYLSHKFKEITNLSYTEYIITLKLNRAVNLLINSNSKIFDISAKCGFSSSSALIFQFNKYLNTTPHKFRKYYSDFNNVVLKDEIHQLPLIKKFFYNFDLNYIEKIFPNGVPVKKKYALNLNTRGIKNINSYITLDLNNINNINMGVNSIIKSLNHSYFDELIINLTSDREHIFFISKENKQVYFNDFDFISIISELKKLKSKVILIFHYNSNPISYLNNILDLITGVIGLKDINQFSFLLNINKSETKSKKTLKLFYNTLIKKFPLTNFQWGVKLDSIVNINDINNYFNFLENVKPNFDSILIDFDYKHNGQLLEESIKYYIDLITYVQKKLSLNTRLLIGFNYDITNIPKSPRQAKYFIILFLFNLSLEIRRLNLSTGYLDYYIMDERNDEKIKSYEYTHNILGVKGFEYYITLMVSNLEQNLLFNNNNIIISKNKNDFSLVIYDNYIDVYNYLIKSELTKENQEIEYILNLEGLNGRYKITEYTLDLKTNEIDIEKDYAVFVSEQDINLFNKNFAPNIKINFIEVDNNNYIYNVRKIFKEIKYIKIETI